MNPTKVKIITLALTAIAVSLTGLNPTAVSSLVNASVAVIAQAIPEGASKQWSSVDDVRREIAPSRESGSDSPTLITLASSSYERIGGIERRVPGLLFRDPRCAEFCTSCGAVMHPAPSAVNNSVMLL